MALPSKMPSKNLTASTMCFPLFNMMQPALRKQIINPLVLLGNYHSCAYFPIKKERGEENRITCMHARTHTNIILKGFKNYTENCYEHIEITIISRNSNKE